MTYEDESLLHTFSAYYGRRKYTGCFNKVTSAIYVRFTGAAINLKATSSVFANFAERNCRIKI